MTKVLIVEDTEELAMLVQATLKRIGLTSHHCHNGESAWEFLQSNRPELIVLDIAMPGMSGWELLEAVRGDDRLRDIRVLVTTAYNDPTNRLMGETNHVDGFIPKPFRPMELVTQVRELLETNQGA